VYALLEIGRRAQRSLCFSSNVDFSLATLDKDVRKRDKPFLLRCEKQGTLHCPPFSHPLGGNMFGFMFELSGDLTPRPGCGTLSDMVVASVIIRRKSSGVDIVNTPAEQGWEELVTPDALRGLIPEVLLEQYEFWKDLDKNVVKGYPVEPKDDWSDYLVTLELQESEKRSECVVRRENHRESMVLLNLASAALDSSLGNLTRALANLDSLSHVLVWSKSQPTSRGEEAEISVVELPRLRIRFLMNHNEEGSARFESLDHTGNPRTSNTFANSLSRPLHQQQPTPPMAEPPPTFSGPRKSTKGALPVGS
jgi:hypothetical protein